MYEPKFNKVLVEIQESVEDSYGKETDNIGGKVYREGKFIDCNELFATQEHALSPDEAQGLLLPLKGKTVMWNEGHEAGTVFEEDGKLYALIYWWDIVACKDMG